MPIDAGELRQIVKFLDPQRVRRASGASEIPSDAVKFWTWGRLLALSAGERAVGDSVQWTATYELTIRYRQDVRADMRVLIDGVIYEIDGPPVDKEGMRRELTLVVHPAARQ